MRLSASQTLSVQRGPASESDSEDGMETTPTVAGRRLIFSEGAGNADGLGARGLPRQPEGGAAAEPEQGGAAEPTGGPRTSLESVEEGLGQLVAAHEHMLQLETRLELARSSVLHPDEAGPPTPADQSD